MEMTESKATCDADICRCLKKYVQILTWVNEIYEQDSKKAKTHKGLIEDAFIELMGVLKQVLHTKPLGCACIANSEEDPKLILKKLMTLQLVEGGISDKQRDDHLLKIVEIAPSLIMNDDENGQTALHLALLQENGKDKKKYALLQRMIGKLKDKNHLHHAFLAKGQMFKGTKMEAATILGVAALSTSENKQAIFKQLVDVGFDLYQRTDNNDNILHSIIRHRQRHWERDVHESTMQIIQENIFGKVDRKVYHMLTQANNAHLTPVIQAAMYGDFKMYEFFMSTKAMRKNVCSDGLMDVHQYDITEIETIPPPRENTRHENISAAAKEEISIAHISVLEFVGHRQSQTVANEFVEFPPIKEVIQHKWLHYRKLLLVWFIFHFLSTACLCATSFYRTQFLSTGTTCLRCSGGGNIIHQAAFVLTLFELVIGILYLFPILSEFVRLSCKQRFTVRPSFAHGFSNMYFRMMFCLFGPLLVLDAGLALIDIDSLILPFALIIACYVFLFFFQVIPTFSAFTVIIQKVIPDMLRFAFVMTALLLGFSMAMFVVMHDADPNDDSFKTLPRTIIKMVSIMIGLGEIDNLFTSRNPYVAIVIFLLFVLLTTILLLNALIAIMSNTCSHVTTEQRGGYSIYYRHCILQRLSAILYIELVCIADFLLKEVGQIERSYFMNGKRRNLKIDSVSDVTTDSEDPRRLSSLFPAGDTALKRPRKKNKVKIAENGTQRKTLDKTEPETIQSMKCSECGRNRVAITGEVPEAVSVRVERGAPDVDKS